MGNVRQGRVYVCKWSKLDDGTYRGVVARPKLQVDDDTLDDLVEPLTNLIAEATGDCEPVIEFDPPILDATRADWFRDGIVSVSPNAHFNFDGIDRLVEGGFCSRCGLPLGERTDHPLKVKSNWPGDALFSWDHHSSGVNLLLFSERLLSVFSPAERKTFEVRPATMPSGTRKKFSEICPKHLVPDVMIRSVEASGWHCKKCLKVHADHGKALGWGVHVISRDSIPDSPMFFVGTSTDYSLCLKPKCWHRLRDALRRNSMVSTPTAVIGRSSIAERAVVPEYAVARRRYARR